MIFGQINTFSFEQKLPISQTEAWSFFSDPKNLAKITPENLAFQLVSSPPAKIYQGLLIRYSLTPFMGVPINWLSEISQIEEGRYFVDKQLIGPYKLWYHQHFFEEIEGGTLVRDVVDYKVGCGIFGDLIDNLFVGRQVREIFAFRSKKLVEIFGAL